MRAKCHSWRTSGLPVSNNGAALDIWVNEFSFFKGKKKQINRPKGNHGVDWLDLWQTAQELFFVLMIWAFDVVFLKAHWDLCLNNHSWIIGWRKRSRSQKDMTEVTQSLERKVSCFPGLFHLDDWGGLKNSPRALATIHHLPLKMECFLAVLWLFTQWDVGWVFLGFFGTW